MLKELTLASIGETRAGGQFEEAIGMVVKSLEKDGDVQGARTITMKLSFTPDDRGYISADTSVEVKTPNRKLKTLAALENGELKIDTVSNDVRQPDLLDGTKDDNVRPFKKEV